MVQGGIVILTSAYILVKMYSIYNKPLKVFVNCVNKELTNENRQKNKPVLVIGIMSATRHTRERNAIRNTWLTLRSFTPFDIKYKFLLDKPTGPEEKENDIHGDILFLNCSFGYKCNLSEKLITWFNFALKNYPDAVLISKMDDDAYPCITKIFGRIFEVMSKDLYFGYELYAPTGLKCLSEVFLVLGRGLVEQFVKVKICDNTLFSDRSCHYAQEAIAEWIKRYKIEAKWVNDNKNWVYFDRLFTTNHKFIVLNRATFVCTGDIHFFTSPIPNF